MLLVEDDPSVREVARRVLERSGYDVLRVDSALEALLVGETHPPEIHLLVTDVVMPKLSGAELASRLLAKRPGLKVLFMSATRIAASSKAECSRVAFRSSKNRPRPSNSRARSARRWTPRTDSRHAAESGRSPHARRATHCS